MKKILSLVLIMASSLVFACEEDTQGVGGAVTDGNSSISELGGGLIGKSIGQIECIDFPPVKVYGYVPSTFTLGGMIGISYALSYAGSGGFIAVVNQDIGCDGPGVTVLTFNFAVDAFEKYYQDFVGSIMEDESTFVLSHPQSSLWQVEFPNGSIGTYRINYYGGNLPQLVSGIVHCQP